MLRSIRAVALVMCGLCASLAQAQSNNLKIGVIGPFTGPSADFGIPMLNGLQLAIDEINAVGGFLGRKLELDIKDDKGNPDEGLKQSQVLIADKVTAVIGFCNTGVAAKSLEVFQTAKVPVIIPCATGSPLTAKYPAPESYICRRYCQARLDQSGGVCGHYRLRRGRA
jgi:branched-chain amino acid transport system substrate-binding protein